MPLSHALFGGVLAAFLWAPSSAAALQREAPEWPPAPPVLTVERMPSGLRVIHLPAVEQAGAEGPGVDVSFGYTVPIPSDDGEQRAHDLVRSWLFASVPARSVQLLAHLSGGRFQVADHCSLTGIRVRVPSQQVDQILELASSFLDQRLVDGELLDYVRGLERGDMGRAGPASDPPAAEIVTSVMLGEAPVADASGAGSGFQPDPGAIEAYFRAHFGTDRAWVIVSTPPDEGARTNLGRVRARTSRTASSTAPRPDAPIGADATLALASKPEGGLVIGSRIESVHYEGWFNTLVVDRAARRVLGPRAQLTFGPSREANVHLIEAAVRLPDYPGDVTNRIWEDLAGLGSTEVQSSRLVQVKQDALAYLAGRSVLEWFAAEDLWRALEDGWSRVWNLTEDEFRDSVGSFLREPRVVATWAPAFDSPVVVVDALGEFFEPEPADTPLRIAPGTIDPRPLRLSAGPSRVPVRVERLSSGVGVAPGEAAVFVAGPGPGSLPGGAPETGPNGTLWTLAEFQEASVLTALADVRGDRLFFFLPPESPVGVRDALAMWNGGPTDASDAMSVGEFATIDLPSLVLLKVWLDRRVIEAGWSGQVQIRIAATEGSRLVVDAGPLYQEEIGRWLAAAADRFGGSDGEVEFEQLRPAAGRYFDEIRRDLEILLWQRAPAAEIPSPDDVTVERFRNVLEVYF